MWNKLKKIIRVVFKNTKNLFLYEYSYIVGTFLIVDYVINTVQLPKLRLRKNVVNGEEEVYYKSKWCKFVEHESKRPFKRYGKNGKFKVTLETRKQRVIFV